MGLRRLISKLDSGDSFGDTYPNHNTPASTGGFNYGQSVSIFDNAHSNNDYFPFKQRSMGYGPQGTKDSTGMFGRIHGPAPYRKQRLPKLKPNKLGPGDTGPIIGVGGVVDAITDVGVRGGLVTAIKRSAIDALRIGEFLISAKGLGFIAKNVGLQMTNPKLQEGSSSKLFGMDLGTNNRIYNLGINTLAQTLVNFSGLHINRAGMLPIGAKNYHVEQGYRPDTEYNETKYEFNVRGDDPEVAGGTGNFTDQKDVYKANRLASLYNKLVNPEKIPNTSYGNPRDLTTTTISNNADFDDAELYEFRGGPHSVYGIGKTRLKRYVYTTRDTAKYVKESILQREGYLESRHMGSQNGPKQTKVFNQVVDFRKFRGIPYTKYNQKLGESGQNLDDKYGYPRGVTRYGIPTNDDGTINIRQSHPFSDSINSTDIWRHEGPFDSTEHGRRHKDFIKFRIEAVNTDKPTESDTMVFRAFLDSMSDSYSSKWNSYNYNGRAEPFYTFGSFNRGISFSFKVAAFTRDDMRPMYRKLNYLVSQTAGEYKDTRLRGNFCRLTIGDYHSRLPGFFTSIGLKWNKDYPWEIAMNQGDVGSQARISPKNHTRSPQSQQIGSEEQTLLDFAADREQRANAAASPYSSPPDNFGTGGIDDVPNFDTSPADGSFQSGIQDMDSDMNELPHMLDVSCTFQPVHDFLPQKSINKSPFIIPVKYNKPSITDQQDWLQWGPISQTERDASILTATSESQAIDADFAKWEAEEKAALAKKEAQEKAERDAWLEEMYRQDEADMAAIEIEEEDSPDPWDQPDTGTVNPNPNDQVFVPGAGGGYDGGFGGTPPLPPE